MDKTVHFLIYFGLFVSISDACLLPFDNGNWISSTRGTWTTSNNGTHSTIANFRADLTTFVNSATLTCVSSSGTQFIFVTNFEIFFSVYIDVYTCIDIRTTSVSPNSYIYYIVTETDPNTGEKFTSDINGACANSNFETPINTNVLLKEGSESSAGVNCPDAILGNYNLVYTDVEGKNIAGSTMDSCNDTKLMVFNNSDSNTKLAFTNDNKLQCLHIVTSGSNEYVHTYNRDTAAADNTNTFDIACWVVQNSGGQVKATIYPNECIQGQSSTSVPYGGQKFVFTPIFTCPLNQQASDGGLATWAIILIVLGILAAIFIIAILILYCRYIRKERHIADDDEKNLKENERNPSPSSLNERDDRVNHVDEIDKRGMGKYDPNKSILLPREKDKRVREHTFDLTEVKISPSNKLQDGKRVDKDIPEPTPIAPIAFPPGKKPIPPTTPKPEEGDPALQRIKKERERKDKEKLEKQKKKEKRDVQDTRTKEKIDEKPPEEKQDKVVKTVKPASDSDEYETDESEKEERMKILMEQRKRLAAAAYQPPEGLPDATVVGKKKRRPHGKGEESGDLTKNLTTREQQELEDKKRRHRKKSMKKMVKKKLRSPSEVETSESEADIGTSKRRHKRRKMVDRGVDAPYMEQYHVKKGIEKELDDIDYWHEKVEPTVISTDDETGEESGKKKSPIQVAPVDTASAPKPSPEMTGSKPTAPGSKLAQIMEEEADIWAAHGLKGFKIGLDGELPDGFHFDDEGNIVRDVDGKVIPKEAFANQMDRRRHELFNLPRLIRNTEGRPLGGYKDDEFGPTAEWDYGLPSANEEEEELKKLESHRPVSGKQVAFSMQDGQSVQQTPLKDMDYSQIKGRQLGSAERIKLKERLFEQQPEVGEPSLPVYFKNVTGVKPDSVYIDNTQVVRQEQKAKPNMVVRSDTFQDGRKMSRNSSMRASWSGRERRIPSLIPEEKDGTPPRGIQGMSREKRNIGSDDEFVLVPGSMQKLNKPPETTDSHLNTHWCSRYQRQGHMKSREATEMSDLNMRTAPSSNRPFSGDDRRMKHLLQELYTDKKYFDHYLESERLPTNAAVETRGLASHGSEFLKERADYWKQHEPINPAPPPSELALRLTRTRTFFTGADSGVESAMSSATGRPHSADDAQETARTGRENSIHIPPPSTVRSRQPFEATENGDSERKPPTGRSDFAPSPSKAETVKREKTVTIDDFENKHEKKNAKTQLHTVSDKDISDRMLPGNVLSVTDT